MPDRIPFTRIHLLLFVSMVLASCGGQHATGPSPKTSPASEGLQAPIQGAGLESPQIAEYVVEVFEDSKGHLWFGTMNKGVARHDGPTLTYFTERDGLCGDTIHSIAEDKDDALWFGCGARTTVPRLFSFRRPTAHAIELDDELDDDDAHPLTSA